MHCKFYHLDGDNIANTEVALTTSYTAVPTMTKDAAMAYGFDLGYWPPRRETQPGTALDPNIFRIRRASAEDHLVVDTIITDVAKSNNRRFFLLGDDSTLATNACVLLVTSADPNSAVKFLNSRELRSENKLVEGFNIPNAVAPEIKKDAQGKVIRPRTTRPGLLICYVGETYEIQYWNHTQHTTYILSFHFDGDSLIIDKNSPKPRPERPKREFNRTPRADGTFGAMFREQVPEFSDRPYSDDRRSKHRKSRDRFERNRREDRWN